MTRPEGAAGCWQATGTADQAQRPAMIAEHGGAGKQAVDSFLRLGTCANCGQHIRLIGGATTCPTCSAWRRWYSAHRLASRYLREVAR